MVEVDDARRPPAPEVAGRICPGAGERLAALGSASEALLMDETHLYAINQDSTIWRIDKRTHEPEKIASLDHVPSRYVFALDGSHVYYAIPKESWLGPASVYRIPKAGGPAEMLFETDLFIGQLAVREGIAFFLTDTREAARSHELLRLELSTGRRETIEGAPVGLFALGPEGELYWPRGDSIIAADAHGKGRREIAKLPEGIGGAKVIGGHLYWWDEDGTIRVYRVPIEGGDREPVLEVEDTDERTFDFDVRGDHIFWTARHGVLSRAKLGVGRPEVILDERGHYDTDYPGIVLVDDQAVYWQAGPRLGERAQDEDPLDLYYSTCLAE
jgi:hypothetical protein